MKSSPQSQGFSLPPEWHPQEAIWLSWPTHTHTWPRHQTAIRRRFAEIAALLSQTQSVRINAAPEHHLTIRQQLECTDANTDLIELYPHPTNDVWCRDHGPIFVQHHTTHELAVIDWTYNAWGGKYPPWNLDNAIPQRIANALQLPYFSIPLVGEGGGIDVNGQGILLTTTPVFQNPNRNPSLLLNEIERLLQESLNVHKIIWLPASLEGDDTDGHIDMLARFVSPNHIIAAYEQNPSAPHYDALQRNWETLQAHCSPHNHSLRCTQLPMPAPVYDQAEPKRQLPATYANFLITNTTVLVPAYKQSDRDQEAAAILQRCFPSRNVHLIDCTELIHEGGALHCISQQQPSKPPHLPDALVSTHSPS